MVNAGEVEFISDADQKPGEVMPSGIKDFEKQAIEANGIEISTHIGGNGPPLILLHGFPQNHMCWCKIAPVLAGSFTCIIPDLRGYGGSSIVADGPDNTLYSKRMMALDIVGIMDALDIQSARVVGHDRGARVAYRLALDHQKQVERLAIIEVVPTVEMWESWNAELALTAYHWTLLAQRHPLPERMIASDPIAFLEWTLASWTASGTLEAFTDEALESYRTQFKEPRRIEAMCCDYRAGATTDRQIDLEDKQAGRKIEAPLHFLWSETGFPSQTGAPLAIWQAWCSQVSGEAIPDTGHFAMEENPRGVLEGLWDFLVSGS